jgi:superfamily I DNA and/or RNA helicase
MRIFPPSTLRLYRTSELPLSVRRERLVLTGKRPGLENPLEAHVVVDVFYQFIRRYPLKEITIITPYRRQVRLIRDSLSLAAVREITENRNLSQNAWEHFLRSRISTVDSFQGGESDVVIICYVRSNEGYGIGFVDDPNRINVAHTRCRREMAIVADIDCLKSQARNQIAVRMERAIIRDGEIIDVENPGAL